jgi:hypothetical protein
MTQQNHQEEGTMEDDRSAPAAESGLLAQWRPEGARYIFHGLMGRRLAANLEHWLLIAPQANPGMLEMFRDRDRSPRRDLVPWAGEFAGKYLTSAVGAWRLTHDERLRTQLDRFVDELIATQDADGYMGPYPREERFFGNTADGKHDLWDLWGHYHCLLGLYLWYKEVDYEPALLACRRAADLICDTFLDSDARVIDTGAEEMNMAIGHVLCLLHDETGEPRYLELARQVEQEWRIPPAGDYMRQALEGVPFFQTPKPRWESLHPIESMLCLYQVTGDDDYRRALEQIWHSIRGTDIHNTGGFTSGERATGNPYDPRAIETCCTVAWMVLSADLLHLSGDAQIADALEISTFNGALGAQHPSGRWWTYNTPMDGARRASAHDIVFQAREGTPELNCCSVNGPRSLALLPEWALMLSDEGPVLNYYGPCSIACDLPSGTRMRITQHTDYPVGGTIHLELDLAHAEHFLLRLRIPDWSVYKPQRDSGHDAQSGHHGEVNDSSRHRVWVNGHEAEGVQTGRYLALDRQWQPGDRITMELDLSLHTWLGEREATGKVSLYRGPLLLAYDRRFSAADPDELPAVDLSRLDAAETVEWAGGYPRPWLLVNVPTVDGGQLTLCDFATAGAAGTPYRTWLAYETE